MVHGGRKDFFLSSPFEDSLDPPDMLVDCASTQLSADEDIAHRLEFQRAECLDRLGRIQFAERNLCILDVV